VPIAATPAATAAFFAVRLSFGRRVLFDAAPLALLVFGLERARFAVDLAFVRLTLFVILLPPSKRNQAQDGQSRGRLEVPFDAVEVSVAETVARSNSAARS
jgi:hypothetical protein